MAEREALQKRYAYAEMSNKVQRADRRSRRDGDGGAGGGPTGEVESLWNVLPQETLGRMGDRVGATADAAADGEGGTKKSERPAEVAEMMERAAKRRKKKETNDFIGGSSAAGSSKRRENILLEGGTSILDDSVGVSAYRPTNPASRSAYETLLNILSSKQYLGNQPSSILRGALEEVLETLKDANYRDPERKEVISKFLTGRGSSLPDAVFAQMVQLGKAMDDYEDYKNRASGQNNNDDENDNNNGMDDEMGVAVVFDDSEEEEEGNRGVDEDERSDVEEDVVVDVDDSSSDEGDGNGEANEGGMPNDESGDEERMVQGSTNRTKSGGGKGGVRILSVHEIDAHYLQRRLAATLDDADECAKVADQVLSVLDIRPGTSIRECENQLLVLLGFERFDLIKTLLANRARIWGCVSIKRAVDESTRDSVEKALMEDESGEGEKALNELRSRSGAEDWKGERMKSAKDTLRKERGDGFDNLSEAAVGESKMSKALDSVKVGSDAAEDGDESPSDAKRSAHELDFDSLAFREGSHTMTNKKCELPDQSWRAMKPGYEEVHVPAVRSVAPPDEKLVPISDLPEWTHDAFKGMTMLNRVQSKMADVALRSSENVLLCAREWTTSVLPCLLCHSYHKLTYTLSLIVFQPLVREKQTSRCCQS